jgi:hypothetical protein
LYAFSVTVRVMTKRIRTVGHVACMFRSEIHEGRYF